MPISVTRLVEWFIPSPMCMIFDTGNYNPKEFERKAKLGTEIHENSNISKHIKACFLEKYTDIKKEYKIKNEELSGIIDYLLYNPYTNEYIIIDIKTNGYEKNHTMTKEEKDKVSLQTKLYHRLIGEDNICRRFVLHITKNKEKMIELKDYPKEEYEQILIFLNQYKKW